MADTKTPAAAETLAAEIRKLGATARVEAVECRWVGSTCTTYPAGAYKVTARMERMGSVELVVVWPEEIATANAGEVVAQLKAALAPKAKATRAAIRRERSRT